MRNKLTVRADIIRPLFTAGFALAIALTLSCSSDDSPSGGGNLGGGDNQVIGGTSSTGSGGGSSPSGGGGSSSVPQCVTAANYCNYGGCSRWSTDGWTCLQSTAGRANEGGCFAMPTDDNCEYGTLVASCPANATPPSLLPSSSSAVSSSSSPESSSSVEVDTRCKTDNGYDLFCLWESGRFALDPTYDLDEYGRPRGRSCKSLVTECVAYGAAYVGDQTVRGLSREDGYICLKYVGQSDFDAISFDANGRVHCEIGWR